MIKAVKGMRDILPPSSSTWNHVEATAREVFRRFNYQEIRTPLLEETTLFARGVGEETDIVTKEMYTFEDRDGTSLTLRPEATASVMRAYIEHRLDQVPGLQKLYYIGPMFRRERPQKGRYRQFFQIGAEAIGSESPAVDAEVIEMVVEILQRSGLSGFKLLINSVGDPNCRPQFVALLKEQLRDIAPRLCGDCQRRAETNPLRVLDCKVPEDQPLIDALPSIQNHLCVSTLMSSTLQIESSIREADLVIGAVLVPGARAPKLVTRDMLKEMKQGSVIVDVAIDQGGCFETSHATTHTDPVFEVDGVTHYCVANMPGGVPVSSTKALTNATLPYVEAIADHGLAEAVARDKALALGVNVLDGKITYEPVAEAHGLDYTPLEDVLTVAA